MLSQNHWVWPFFAFFRFVREILFVTVALDHPVLGGSDEAGFLPSQVGTTSHLSTHHDHDHPDDHDALLSH